MEGRRLRLLTTSAEEHLMTHPSRYMPFNGPIEFKPTSSPTCPRWIPPIWGGPIEFKPLDWDLQPEFQSASTRLQQSSSQQRFP